jgi:hypothetical protein
MMNCASCVIHVLFGSCLTVSRVMSRGRVLCFLLLLKNALLKMVTNGRNILGDKMTYRITV